MTGDKALAFLMLHAHITWRK